MNNLNNVWRIGSRIEGKSEKSLLGIFRRNNIVFLEDERQRDRFMSEVKYNDYFAISDGLTIVAVARALGEPKSMQNIDLAITDEEEKRISYRMRRSYMVGVKVKIVDLKKTERFKIDHRWTFYRLNPTNAEQVINLYNNRDEIFEINSFTCTLTSSTERCLFDGKHKYVIPVYQRPYSWGEDQIKPFYRDILDGFLGKERDPEELDNLKDLSKSEPMFVGTMQLSAEKYVSANEVWQDVIDGQQRITTISILLKELLDMLSLHSSSEELYQYKELHFDWLETRVNQEQQKFLKNYFGQKRRTEPTLSEEQIPSQCDPYVRNSHIIRDLIEQTLGSGEECREVKLLLIRYILEKIYFVVIETRAGLSKTLKIFDVINTTGLDLNGGDIFKIRMYEYLKDQPDNVTKEPFGEKAFDKISEMYDLLERKNQELSEHKYKHYTQEEQKRLSANSVTINNTNIVSIGNILSLYKDILITDYQLPSVLYDFGWETFFDRLFDTILGVKQWEHFNKDVALSVDVLADIIELYFTVKETYFENLEAMFAYHLIGWSRYPRYKNLIYLYSYYHRDQIGDINYQGLAQYLIELNKLFFVYSVNYGKALTKIHSFMREKSVRKGLFNEEEGHEKTYSIVEKVHELLVNETESFKNNLGGQIADNMRTKRLICLMAEFFEIKSHDNLTIKDAHSILFKTHFDIEHIHARNADAKSGTQDKLVDSELNCIGNLCLLEYDINRSIKDNDFLKKKEQYSRSKFITIKELIDSGCDVWNSEQILGRKKEVVDAIMNYIFPTILPAQY